MRHIRAWHFLLEGLKLADYGDALANKVIRKGSVLHVEPPLSLCERGLHGSKRIIDALGFAPGPIICRTEHWGEIVEGDDKLCSEYRKVLWWIDGTNILHEFACLCAEDALKLIKNPDPRSVAAIEAKRRWVRGEITDQELAAAGAAAREQQNRRLARMVRAEMERGK